MKAREPAADAAQFPDIAQEEARAQEDDACLQPELVGGDAGLEDLREAEDIGNDQANEDGPEDVLDVGDSQMVALGIGIDVFFEELAGETDGKEQGQTGKEPEEFGADGAGWILWQGDGSSHG